MWIMGLHESDMDLAHIYAMPARFMLEGRSYPRTLWAEEELPSRVEVRRALLRDKAPGGSACQGQYQRHIDQARPIVIMDSPDLHELRRII